MGKLILVTGGARSGKSSFAEELAEKCGEDVLYIATSIPFDDEMKFRIKKHREQRPSHWETIEIYKEMDIGLADKISGKCAVMLDCITIMVSNLIFEKNYDRDNFKTENLNELEDYIKSELHKLLNVIRNGTVPFILVTNEIGMGIVPDNAISRVFRDIAGRANQMLAKAAEDVYLCVSGIPVKIK